MVTIKLDGKEHKLNLLYDGIEYLEEEYDMAFYEVLQKVDVSRQKHMRKLYTALLLDENENIKESEVKAMIRASLNKGEVTLRELMEKASKAIEQSQPMKDMVEEGKKQQEKTNLKKVSG